MLWFCVSAFLCSVYCISYVGFSYRSLYGVCFMILYCILWLPYGVMNKWMNEWKKGRSCRWNTFSDPLPTVLSYMLPELHAFKVLFYAESVGVVTSGHLTKMTVTPFDPQWPITPCYTQTLRLYLLQNRSYCRLKFYIAGIGNFAFFPKNSGNY